MGDGTRIIDQQSAIINQTRHVIGAMTGTSLDGLDAALVRLDGQGPGLSVHLLDRLSLEMPDDLRDTLVDFTRGQAHPPLTFMRTGRRLGVLYAQACHRLAAGLAPLTVDFVVAHGQTIWHAPADGLSWQLFDPWPIVRLLGVPVCHELRQADLIAGGQGAPITPIADPMLYATPRAVVLNLGGICNATWWSGGELGAADLGPCNLLIDGVVRRLFPGRRFDDEGALSRGVEPDPAIATVIRESIDAAAASGRSLGREQFSAAWRDRWLERVSASPPATVLASAIAAAAQRIASALPAASSRDDQTADPRPIILAGGGSRNATLCARLEAHLPGQVTSSETWGVPGEAREAMALAVLGALSRDGVPITLPSVTAADAPGIAGAWAGAAADSIV